VRFFWGSVSGPFPLPVVPSDLDYNDTLKNANVKTFLQKKYNFFDFFQKKTGEGGNPRPS